MYENDSRVTANDDGTFTINDPTGSGAWTVEEAGGTWLAIDRTTDAREWAHTADDVIRQIIGDPEQ